MYGEDIKSYERRYGWAKDDAMKHIVNDEPLLALASTATMLECKAAIRELRYQQNRYDRRHDDQ